MTPVNYCPNCGGSVTANNVGQADCPNYGMAGVLAVVMIALIDGFVG